MRVELGNPHHHRVGSAYFLEGVVTMNKTLTTIMFGATLSLAIATLSTNALDQGAGAGASDAAAGAGSSGSSSGTGSSGPVGSSVPGPAGSDVPSGPGVSAMNSSAAINGGNSGSPMNSSASDAGTVGSNAAGMKANSPNPQPASEPSLSPAPTTP